MDTSTNVLALDSNSKPQIVNCRAKIYRQKRYNTHNLEGSFRISLSNITKRYFKHSLLFQTGKTAWTKK